MDLNSEMHRRKEEEEEKKERQKDGGFEKPNLPIGRKEKWN
jgi:hypothetical protein